MRPYFGNETGWEACGNLVRTKRNADGTGGYLVAEVPPSTPQTLARAALIAAAPELLAALEGLLNALPSATTHPAIRSARAAIADAEGVK